MQAGMLYQLYPMYIHVMSLALSVLFVLYSFYTIWPTTYNITIIIKVIQN